MTPAQTLALTHPLNRADNPDTIARHRRIAELPDGRHLVIVLAVDR